MSSSFLSSCSSRRRRSSFKYMFLKKRTKYAVSSRHKSRNARAGRRGTKKKDVEQRVKKFLKWCGRVGITLHPNVCITNEDTCDGGVGVRATGTISEGDCVATIPRAAVLSCSNNCRIAERVAKEDTLQQESTSSWLPLLLTLAAEYSKKYSSRIFSRSISKWDRYLSLVPSEANLPMMWKAATRQLLLEGTAVNSWVDGDLQRMQDDFESLVRPFMKKNSGIFRKGVRNWRTFVKLSAFVMAYSFTDEEADHLGSTMMVPFVDLLNHSSTNHVELTFHPSCLQLLAVRNIHKGEEVMNTYGQLSNAELLHKYGFTEQDNPHDEAIVAHVLIRDVYLELYPNSSCLWDSLCSQGMVEEEYSVDIDGHPELLLLAVVSLLLSALMDTSSERRLLACPLPGTLEQCSHLELAFLTKLARRCLDAFPEEVTSMTPISCIPIAMSPIEKNSLRLVLGQQNCLRKLLLLATLAMDRSNPPSSSSTPDL